MWYVANTFKHIHTLINTLIMYTNSIKSQINKNTYKTSQKHYERYHEVKKITPIYYQNNRHNNG